MRGSTKAIGVLLIASLVTSACNSTNEAAMQRDAMKYASLQREWARAGTLVLSGDQSADARFKELGTKMEAIEEKYSGTDDKRTFKELVEKAAEDLK